MSGSREYCGLATAALEIQKQSLALQQGKVAVPAPHDAGPYRGVCGVAAGMHRMTRAPLAAVMVRAPFAG